MCTKGLSDSKELAKVSLVEYPHNGFLFTLCADEKSLLCQALIKRKKSHTTRVAKEEELSIKCNKPEMLPVVDGILSASVKRSVLSIPG
jgi:hypothetical protein